MFVFALAECVPDQVFWDGAIVGFSWACEATGWGDGVRLGREFGGVDVEGMGEGVPEILDGGGACGGVEFEGGVGIFLVEDGACGDVFCGERVTAPDLAVSLVVEVGRGVVFEFGEVFGVVLEEESDEGIVGLWVDETDGPEVIACVGRRWAVLEFSVWAHPDDVGEGLTGEDPFIIAEGGCFEGFQCLHGAEFVEPWEVGVEAVFDVDVESGGGVEGVERCVGESPAADEGGYGAADDLEVWAGVPEGDTEFLEVT